MNNISLNEPNRVRYDQKISKSYMTQRSIAFKKIICVKPSSFRSNHPDTSFFNFKAIIRRNMQIIQTTYTTNN